MVSGRRTDKSIVFTPFYDESGKAPMISECPLNYLCKIMQSVPICGFEVFFGEIVSAYVNGQCLTDGKPDPIKINPMVLMGANFLLPIKPCPDVMFQAVFPLLRNPA